MVRARTVRLELRPLGALLLAYALAFVSSPAAATPPMQVRLSYALGAGALQCPPEAALRRGVAARLGRDPFRSDAAQLVAVRVEATRAGLTATVEVRDAAGGLVGKRTVEASRWDCAELAAAVELAADAMDGVRALRPTGEGQGGTRD